MGLECHSLVVLNSISQEWVFFTIIKKTKNKLTFHTWVNLHNLYKRTLCAILRVCMLDQLWGCVWKWVSKKAKEREKRHPETTSYLRGENRWKITGSNLRKDLSCSDEAFTAILCFKRRNIINCSKWQWKLKKVKNMPISIVWPQKGLRVSKRVTIDSISCVDKHCPRMVGFLYHQLWGV